MSDDPYSFARIEPSKFVPPPISGNIHTFYSRDDQGNVWWNAISYGVSDSVIDFRPRFGPPKPFTLHERWSGRVNWWLAERLETLGQRFTNIGLSIADVGDWINKWAYRMWDGF